MGDFYALIHLLHISTHTSHVVPFSILLVSTNAGDVLSDEGTFPQMLVPQSKLIS